MQPVRCVGNFGAARRKAKIKSLKHAAKIVAACRRKKPQLLGGGGLGHLSRCVVSSLNPARGRGIRRASCARQDPNVPNVARHGSSYANSSAAARLSIAHHRDRLLVPVKVPAARRQPRLPWGRRLFTSRFCFNPPRFSPTFAGRIMCGSDSTCFTVLSIQSGRARRRLARIMYRTGAANSLP